MNLLDAQVTIERWRQEYNEERPHSSLDYLPPEEFARQQGALQKQADPKVAVTL